MSNFAAVIVQEDYAAYFVICIFLFASFLYSFTGVGEGASAVSEVKHVAKPDVCAELFRDMQLEGTVNYTAFRQAVTGYYRIAQRKRDILTLIDFPNLLPKSVCMYSI